jgi:hypothetical protein
MKSAEKYTRNAPMHSAHHPSPTLLWIERLAIFTALASAIGLIGLTSSRSSWGQEPPPSPPGFTGGAKPFSNPFAPGATPPAGDGNDFFDDELPDEEDFDFPPPPGAGGGNFTPPSRSNPTFNSNDSAPSDRGSFRAGGASAGAASSGISMGGSGNGIVTARPQAPSTLTLRPVMAAKRPSRTSTFPTLIFSISRRRLVS